jgi:hypothetical protein
VLRGGVGLFTIGLTNIPTFLDLPARTENPLLPVARSPRHGTTNIACWDTFKILAAWVGVSN